jgi:hypothetical protein
VCEGKRVIHWTGDFRKLGVELPPDQAPRLMIATRVATTVTAITLTAK